MGAFLSIAVDATDVARLARVAAGGTIITAAVGAAIDDLEQQLVAAIQRHMQFDKGYSTGALSDSVQAFRQSLMETEVGPDMPYEEFVEYGTGQRGAASGVDHPSDYSYGSKPGMAAEPYMHPAYDEMRPVMEDRVRQGVESGLARLVG